MDTNTDHSEGEDRQKVTGQEDVNEKKGTVDKNVGERIGVQDVEGAGKLDIKHDPEPIPSTSNEDPRSNQETSTSGLGSSVIDGISRHYTTQCGGGTRSKRPCTSEESGDEDLDKHPKWRRVKESKENDITDFDKLMQLENVDSDSDSKTVSTPTDSGYHSDSDSNTGGLHADAADFEPVKFLTFDHCTAAPKENESAETHINILPPMIMTRIFEALSLPDLLKRASLVCRYWCHLARDPALWREINLKGLLKVDDKTMLNLVQLSQNVSGIDVTDSKLVTSGGLQRALKYCPTLKCLKIVR